MIPKAHHFGTRLQEQFWYMIMFALVFSLIGTGVTNINHYLNERTEGSEYYKIIPPVRTDKSEYKACDIMTLYVTRDAQLTTGGETIFALELLKRDGNTIRRIYSTKKTMIINKGINTIETKLELPCTAEVGNYDWNMLATFNAYGNTKTVNYQSEPFKIIK